MHNSSRRRPGTGSLYVKDLSWYGRWRNPDGEQVARRLGSTAELSRADADERLKQIRRLGGRYRKRAKAPRFNAHAGVYFIVGADRVKIGRTERMSVADRLARLRRFSPVPLTLHRFIAVPYPDVVERALQDRFAAHHDHDEWFDICVLQTIDHESDDEILSAGTRCDAID